MTDKEFKLYLNDFPNKPHLVILGAGATMATIPNGDKNGKKSSVMNNFIDELGLGDILKNINLSTNSSNLEDIYSELYDKEEYKPERENLEQSIKNYLSELKLPDYPTIYDFLILSLRNKDCIASFNWDDLLIKAYQRSLKITDNLPNLLFLHGNVSAGFCAKCGEYGALNLECPNCGVRFIPSPILFPIKNKNYSSDQFIKTQWEQFKIKIQEAGFLTIFGYNAPQTDVEAIRIMQNAFSTESKFWHEIEVIDIADKSKITNNWAFFGERTHWHFNVVESFFDSILAEFPRRSMEGYYKRKLSPKGGWWGKSRVQFKNTFDNLNKIVEPLIENEKDNNYEVI